MDTTQEAIEIIRRRNPGRETMAEVEAAPRADGTIDLTTTGGHMLRETLEAVENPGYIHEINGRRYLTYNAFPLPLGREEKQAFLEETLARHPLMFREIP